MKSVQQNPSPQRAYLVGSTRFRAVYDTGNRYYTSIVKLGQPNPITNRSPVHTIATMLHMPYFTGKLLRTLGLLQISFQLSKITSIILAFTFPTFVKLREASFLSVRLSFPPIIIVELSAVVRVSLIINPYLLVVYTNEPTHTHTYAPFTNLITPSV